MTKYKAKKLVDKFKPFVESEPFYSNKGGAIQKVIVYNAKQFALICVDEIQKLPNIGHSHSRDESQYDFWQQVKLEIENL